ncbi:collagen alpha-6(VI) chain-like isoform X2 [Sardina pilchardus]|uniref:collagen alpha-6(VI) chain-like isoform X2 n=1 Tax=Sardina pilchardus TaxID=27697 RepID=UPI002E144051
MALLLVIILIGSCVSVCATEQKVCTQEAVADIVFLVDGSWSIGKENFREVQAFLHTLVDSFSVSPDRVRIGLVQYSNSPKTEFLLNTHQHKQEILAYIKRLPYKGGGTMTGLGLDFILKEQFTEQAGSRARQGVPQIAVVITDGRSQDDVEPHADDLRRRGIILYAIGIKDADEEQLKEIANEPHDQHVYSVSDFSALQGISQNIVQVLCTTVEETTRQITQASQEFADVFFLVDSSTQPQQFQMIRSILIQMANQLNVNIDQNRMGLAQFSDNTKVEFLLNGYKTKEEILAHLKRFRLERGGARNIGAALEYTRTHFLTPKAGARLYPGFRQYLVLMTSGKSDDSVYRPSRALKDQSINVITVGFTNADPLEMQIIATESSMSKTVGQNFMQITQEINSIITSEDTLSVEDECDSATVADIVFIMDQSSTTEKENLKYLRNFLYRIVAGLDISSNKVRVGVVLYSDTPKAEMYLNTYGNKQDILHHIRRFLFLGGTIRKTGEALTFAKNVVFTTKRGSRQRYGVQQLAIVLTSGHSVDDVSNAAKELRQSGVRVFTVGVKNSNTAELEQIASYPPQRFVFTVEDFTRLSNIQRDLRTIICHEISRIHQGLPGVKGRPPATKVYSRTQEIVPTQGCLQTEEADIYFLIDESGSISNEDFPQMKKFILEFLLMFHIGPKHVRVGLVKFSSQPKCEVNLLQSKDRLSFEAAVDKVYQDGGGTNIGKAIHEMQSLFQQAVVSRPNLEIPRILIVITDGKSQDDAEGPAKVLREQGVIIYTIGVKGANKQELEVISGDPGMTFMVNNFDALLQIRHEIIRKMCSKEACTDMKADVLLLVESSSIISMADFVKIKMFIESLVDRSVIGPHALRMGLVQYATQQQLAFSLDTHYKKDELLKQIKAMSHLGGGTETGKALRYVSQFFDRSMGGRPGVPQILIVVSEGKSLDDIADAVDVLKQKGVITYAIGIGSANSKEMSRIGGGIKNKYYFLKNFDRLRPLPETIMFDICHSEGCQIDMADIIFLVEGSQSVSHEQFQIMKHLMSSIVNSSSVGGDHVRIGGIVYSTEPQIQFDLNQYDTRKELRQAISRLRPSGGDTYTSRALSYALKYFNGAQSKKRGHKFLIIITNEEARDDHQLDETSAKLRNNGISIFGIGVKQDRNTQLPNQLFTMTNNHDRVFYVDNLNALQILDRKISQEICNVNKADCKMDLVMLVDGSESIATSHFSIMKKFMTDMVKSFNISSSFLQVGVAQFSTHQQKEFYLNEYETGTDIIKAIDGIKQLKEGTKIVPGLNFTREFFKTEHGSRRSMGVRQTLLLITDGETEEDVETATYDLRADKIDVFVIGVGRVQTDQLLKIAGSKDRFFPIDAYEELTKILTTLVGTFCPPSDEPDPDPNPTPIPKPNPDPGCNVDIAIGFDYARRPINLPLVLGPFQLKQQLPKIINKISSLDNICCVPNSIIKTKIAFNLVNKEGKELDFFPFEEYNSDVVKKVTELVINKDSVFNTPLLKSFEKVFKYSAAKVKVLIIFSDGLDEPVEKLELELGHLRRSAGVSALVTVALEGAQNTHELQMLEFGGSVGYHRPFSIRTYNIEEAIQKEIDTATERVCCGVMCKCSGPDGMRGPRGPPGQKGNPGSKGHVGYPGEEGGSGYRGPPGQIGIQGFEGCRGIRGQKGTRGYNGEVGEDGEHGLDGVYGEQGETGVTGVPGDRGEPGSPGGRGTKGVPGITGQRGQKGDTGKPGADNISAGQKGQQGNKGRQGDIGQDGLAGRAGDPGNLGPAGRRGPTGIKGSRGDPGERGHLGHFGLKGPPGNRGPIGQPGQIGLPGLPGLQGPQGSTGHIGHRGSPGQKGHKGQPGEPGVKGHIGSVGARGFPGQDGRDGYGFPGPKGSKGQHGYPGYQGLQGEYGAKGQIGGPGSKGSRGQGGKSGRNGPQGEPGTPGIAGHRGPRGAPGPRQMSDCELINYVRDNCACNMGHEDCPAYPTELVIALDMSEDVTPEAFERMRAIVHHLLEDMSISESNCPRGARVAIVSFSSSVKYLVRFSDYHRKKHLIEEVNNIALEHTSNRRNIGTAMRFVARHVFKRTRKALLMRKVAIFITNGASQDVKSINTAVLEFKAHDIHPAVISFRNVPNVLHALEADETRSFIVKLVGSGQELKPQLSEVQKCIICYDPCKKAPSCSSVNQAPTPIQVDLDLAVLVDGSHIVQADQYGGVKELLGSVVEQITVSSQPSRSDNQARVALYQASSAYRPTAGQVPVQQEFDFMRFQDSSSMKSHIFQSVQQLGGSSRLGYALKWVINRGLLTATKPRKNRMVLAIVGGETSHWDRAQLEYASKLASCQGVVLFTLTVGDTFNTTQVEELASLPLEQHMVHLGQVKKGEQEYATRFLRTFLSFLKRGINTYPVPSERWMCQHLEQEIDQEPTIVLIDSIPLPTSNYNPQPSIPNWKGDAQVETLYEIEHGVKENTGRGDTSGYGIVQQREDLSRLEDFDTVQQREDITSLEDFEKIQQKEDLSSLEDFDTVQQREDITSLEDFERIQQREDLSTWEDFDTVQQREDITSLEDFETIQQREDLSTLEEFDVFHQRKDETLQDVCTLRQDEGKCQKYTVKWYFDTVKKECLQFWYSGCDGNGNRFRTKADCVARCMRTKANGPAIDAR